MMALEPWAWSVVGLVARPNHRKRQLLATAALHSAHSGWVYWRLRRRPELAADRSWLARHGVLTAARYLVYPAIADRRTYWRSNADDSAFFMQAWAPVVLLGAAGSPAVATAPRAMASGFAVGATLYLAGARLNGERLTRLGVVAGQRVLNYSVSSAMVGLVVHIIVRLLNDASETIEKEKEEFGRVYQDEEYRRMVRSGREEDTALLDSLAAVASRHFAGSPELASGVRRLVDAKAETLAAEVPPLRAVGLADLAAATAEPFPLAVRVTSPQEASLAAHEAVAVPIFLKNAFDNAVRRGHATEAQVTYTCAGNVARLTVSDNGRGFIGEPGLVNGHGLAIAQAMFRSMGGDVSVGNAPTGGAEVSGWWTRQPE
ncbi:MAG: ATP-binding protein [Actinomycetota bacterium]